MGVAVAFNYPNWIALFPEFTSTVNSTQATTLVLPLAESYTRNDGGGPVTDIPTQTNLLNLMVAHVAQLLYGSSAQPLSPIVGRVASATQGSVSVSTDMPSNPDDAWYLQTRYGAMWLRMAQPWMRANTYVVRNRCRRVW